MAGVFFAAFLHVAREQPIIFLLAKAPLQKEISEGLGIFGGAKIEAQPHNGLHGRTTLGSPEVVGVGKKQIVKVILRAHDRSFQKRKSQNGVL